MKHHMKHKIVNTQILGLNAKNKLLTYMNIQKDILVIMQSLEHSFMWGNCSATISHQINQATKGRWLTPIH